MGHADTMKPESGPQFGCMLKINEVVANQQEKNPYKATVVKPLTHKCHS